MQGRAENRTREFIAGKIQIQVYSLIGYIDHILRLKAVLTFKMYSVLEMYSIPFPKIFN